MKRNERGFTLMELMVVIVIVAILAAVAVPLYINYVKDAQRTEAKGAIGAIISAEQVWYQDPNKGNGTYATQNLGTAQAIETQFRIDLTEPKKNWLIVINANGQVNDGFQVVATGQGPAQGLTVTYNHSRSNGGTWTET